MAGPREQCCASFIATQVWCTVESELTSYKDIPNLVPRVLSPRYSSILDFWPLGVRTSGAHVSNLWRHIRWRHILWRRAEVRQWNPVGYKHELYFSVAFESGMRLLWHDGIMELLQKYFRDEYHRLQQPSVGKYPCWSVQCVTRQLHVSTKKLHRYFF